LPCADYSQTHLHNSQHPKTSQETVSKFIILVSTNTVPPKKQLNQHTLYKPNESFQKVTTSECMHILYRVRELHDISLLSTLPL